MKTTTKAKTIEGIMKNPDVILILLGLTVLLFAFLLPLSIGVQTVCGGLGLCTLITGIIIHRILVGT